MNNQNKFNISQKEMTGTNSKFEKSGNSFSGSVESLKGKLLDLEQRILDVAGIFNEENQLVIIKMKWIIILLIKKMKMLNYKKKLLI